MIEMANNSENLPAKRSLADLQEIVNETDGFRLSDKGRQALSVATTMRNTRHGLYARAPMICKGENSPCYKTCPLKEFDLLPDGERCPIEIAAIIDIFSGYCDSLQVDPQNIVDLGLVKELSQIEVTMDRCTDRIAQEDMVQQVTVGVSENGQKIEQPQIHKALEIYDKMSKRKHEILKLLASTRQDQSKDEKGKSDIAAELIEMVQKKRRLEQEKALSLEVQEK